MLKKVVSKAVRLTEREDFRRNPLRAVGIRVLTNAEQRIGRSEFSATLDDDIRVSSPYTSSPGKAIRYLGVSEPETLATIRRLMVDGGVMVDIGAHLGEYALLSAKYMGPDARVLAFEPGKEIFPFLEKNARESRFSHQIQSHPIAVSESDGFLTFDVGADPGHSRIHSGNTNDAASALSVRESEKVPSVRLDTFLTQLEMEPDLVKIDVEGAEAQVFRGMSGLLEANRTTRPAIIFEYIPRTWDVYEESIEDSIRFLNDFGYRVYGTAGDVISEVRTRAEADAATSALDLDLLALLPEHVERSGLRIGTH